MTIMTEERIQRRLIGIAKSEQDIKLSIEYELPDLESHKSELESKLAEIKKRISLLKSGKDEQKREELQTDFDAHLQAGGDPKVHDRITLRRNSKWMYDQKAALVWAQEGGVRDVIRTKESLDKRKMDKLVEEGYYPDAEQVHSVSIIIPTLLGDLLITGGGNE